MLQTLENMPHNALMFVQNLFDNDISSFLSKTYIKRYWKNISVADWQ